jgi:lipooligosaccharide transport system ATP-binding protein
MSAMSIIHAESLTKCYNSLCAVNSIDFEINAGECFGFLGPNGAGKTTVMGIIYCYMPPTSGTVTVFGRDVTSEASAIKERLGVMPQDNNLDPDLTVFENLLVYARYFDIVNTDAADRARDLLRFVELEQKSAATVQKLSGGMKRRLLLARSLINRPDLLILDEPTTGLDPHSRHSVWDQLKELRESGMTLLLTTHYMEEAEKLCDRVAIMDSGRIVATDTPENLMKKHSGNLEDVYLLLTGKSLEG